MKNLLRAALLSSMLLLGAHHAAAQVAIGIQIGPPPSPRHYVVPASPGPGYFWVDAYWYPVNGRYVWHRGYWTRPPYAGAHWIGPRHEGGRFYAGYWDGPHGRFDHDHHWDHDHDRDHDRWHH
jgi:WXXGXW repeat (2 copies)